MLTAYSPEQDNFIFSANISEESWGKYLMESVHKNVVSPFSPSLSHTQTHTDTHRQTDRQTSASLVSLQALIISTLNTSDVLRKTGRHWGASPRHGATSRALENSGEWRLLTDLKAPVDDAYQVAGYVEASLQLGYCTLHVAPRQRLGEIGEGQGPQKHLQVPERERKRERKRERINERMKK